MNRCISSMIIEPKNESIAHTLYWSYNYMRITDRCFTLISGTMKTRTFMKEYESVNTVRSRCDGKCTLNEFVSQLLVR